MQELDCALQKYRDLLHRGAVRRMKRTTPIYAHVVIGEEGERFLLFVFFTETT
jgi:hypothetical protein